MRKTRESLVDDERKRLKEEEKLGFIYVFPRKCFSGKEAVFCPLL